MISDYVFILYSGCSDQPITKYDNCKDAMAACEKLNVRAQDLGFAYVVALHISDYHHLHRNKS